MAHPHQDFPEIPDWERKARKKGQGPVMQGMGSLAPSLVPPDNNAETFMFIVS